VSSEYYAICLNHDPALSLHDQEWGANPQAAEAAIAERPNGPYANHPTCDLLIARSSGNIIKIGCPRTFVHLSHADTEWVDVGWLRLLGRVIKDSSGRVATGGLGLPSCWTKERVSRLAPLLEAAYA
jgi:hypothetical protein